MYIRCAPVSMFSGLLEEVRVLSFVDLDRSLSAVPGPVVMQLARVDIGHRVAPPL